MTTATLSFGRVQKNIQAKINAVELPALNWKAICFAGFLMFVFLLVFYAWQISSLTQGSYLISSYEKQISKLSDENKNLEVSFAENSFLGQSLAKIKALNFQDVTNSSVKYIQIPENAVATAAK